MTNGSRLSWETQQGPPQTPHELLALLFPGIGESPKQTGTNDLSNFYGLLQGRRALPSMSFGSA